MVRELKFIALSLMPPESGLGSRASGFDTGGK
jgi:hypothetical protein